jgi:hypothetical protein
MQSGRLAAISVTLVMVGGLAATGSATSGPGQAKEDIWKDEPVESRQPAWRRDLTEDMINRVMKGLTKRDPAKARALEKLRQKDPEAFKTELRESARPELDQIGRDYWEARRQKRTADFLEWLKAAYPQEEQRLATLREKDPQLYAKTLDHQLNQYGYIFDAHASNPELGAVLKEDFDLKKRTDELCRQLRRERSEAKRQELGIELQEVVARRYDLIVRRKEIAYEQLLKRLEDLQKQVIESRGEIAKYKDGRIKQENVRQRVQALSDNKVKFKWD